VSELLRGDASALQTIAGTTPFPELPGSEAPTPAPAPSQLSPQQLTQSAGHAAHVFTPGADQDGRLNSSKHSPPTQMAVPLGFFPAQAQDAVAAHRTCRRLTDRRCTQRRSRPPDDRGPLLLCLLARSQGITMKAALFTDPAIPPRTFPPPLAPCSLRSTFAALAPLRSSCSHWWHSRGLRRPRSGLEGCLSITHMDGNPSRANRMRPGALFPHLLLHSSVYRPSLLNSLPPPRRCGNSCGQSEGR